MTKTMQMKVTALAALAATIVACQNDRADRAIETPAPAEPMAMETTNLPAVARVSDVQRALNLELGTSLTESGVMDAATKDALRRFQTQESLAVTGSIDSATLQALGLPTSASTPTSPGSQVDPAAGDRAPASVPESAPAPRQY